MLSNQQQQQYRQTVGQGQYLHRRQRQQQGMARQNTLSSLRLQQLWARVLQQQNLICRTSSSRR
jgi:hypothetical protein